MDVFLSYAWGEFDASGVRPLQQKAHAIAAAIRDAGYSVWLDTEQMPGCATGGADLSDAMSVGISSASRVVVCVSEAYARSANCKGELTFAASTLRKKCFYVNVGEASYTPQSYAHAPDPDHKALSWLPFIMRNPLWADCRTPEAAASAAGVAQLLRSLAESTGSGKPGSPATPAAAAALAAASPRSADGILGASDAAAPERALVAQAPLCNDGSPLAPPPPGEYEPMGIRNAAGRAADDDVASSAVESPSITWSQLRVSPDDAAPRPGGMGVVFKATFSRSRHTREVVAVKVIKASTPELAAVANEALKREGETLSAAADHGLNPYVVPQFGLVQGTPTDEWRARLSAAQAAISPDGSAFGIVMKWVDCGTLSSRMHNCRVPWAPKTSARLLLLERIAFGVASLHDLRPQQIIHGDIKSENVLLKETGEPVLSDSGISRTRAVVAETAAGVTQGTTTQGRQAGTWAYMAPEMVKTDVAAKPASTSTDVYALGTLAWEVLVGATPWAGEDVVSRMFLLSKGAALDWSKLPRDTPRSVREILERATGALPRPSAHDLVAVFSAARRELESEHYDVFLSHMWMGSEHARITTLVYDVLHDGMKLRVWLDKHDMGLDMDASMDLGVSASTCVVALVSREYAARPNCMRELRAAARLSKKIVVGIVDPDASWWPSRTADSSQECELAILISSRVVSETDSGKAGNLFADLRCCVDSPAGGLTDSAMRSVQILQQLVQDALCPDAATIIAVETPRGDASMKTAGSVISADTRSSGSSGVLAASHPLLSAGCRGYFQLSFFSNPRLGWDVCGARASLFFAVNHRVEETKIICFRLQGSSNQTFLLEAIDSDGCNVTITPRCCEGKLFVGEVDDKVCLVSTAVVWRVDAVPGIRGHVTFSLGDRTIQFDDTISRPLVLVKSGTGNAERQIFRADLPPDARLRGIESTSAIANAGAAASSAVPNLLSDVYFIRAFKDGKAWDIPAISRHNHIVGTVGAAPVIMWPFHGKLNQKFTVDATEGSVTIAPWCCRDKWFLGVMGSSVYFVDRPYFWRLENVDGVKGRFRISDDKGQRIESEWPWATLIPSLIVNSPSTTRRQIFEFTAVT